MGQNVVELIVKSIGAQEAIRMLEQLSRLKETLHRQKIDLQIEKARLNRDINEVKLAIRKLKDGENAVKITIDGKERVLSSVKEAKAALQELTDRRNEIRLETGEANAELAKTRYRVSELKDEIDDANSSLAQMADRISNVGNAFQSIGGVSGAIGNFANSIGGAFSEMGKLYEANIFEYVSRALTELGTTAIVGGMNKITSRYDIMKSFTDYMELAGVLADDAQAALDRVDESIRGLPIGLDESAQRLRRYQMFLGDINRSTNLTIGLQKALYAGGANEQMRTTSLYEMERLLTAGELSTKRQWQAMIQGLGVSVRFLADELGASQQELPNLLSSGAISAQQFLNALESLGEGSSKAAQDLDAALDIYKNSIESWISNIQYAAVRGGERILKSMNAALEEGMGQGIVGYMRDIRDAMNTMYAGAGQWILDNPSALAVNISAIDRLLESLKRFSASNVATMIFDNLARGVDMITQAINRLPAKQVEEFIAFATTLAGPLGKLFQTVSAGAPIVLGIFDRFKDFDFEHLLDRIITQAERLAKAISGLLSVIPDGMMTELIAFGLTWGKPIGTVLNGIGDALVRLSIIMQSFNVAGLIAKFHDLYQHLKTIFYVYSKYEKVFPTWRSKLLMLAGSVGVVAASFGTLAAVYRSIGKRDAEAAHLDLGLDEIDKDVEKARSAIEHMKDTVSDYQSTISEAGESAKTAKELLQEAFRLDLSSNPADLERLQIIVGELTRMYPELNLEISDANGHLKSHSQAAREAAQNVIEYADAQARANAALSALDALYEDKIALDVQRRVLEERKKQLQKYIDDSRDMIKKAFEGAGNDSDFEWTRSGNTDSQAVREYSEELTNVEESLKDVTEAASGTDDEIRALQEILAEYSVTASDVAVGNEEMASSTKAITDRIKAMQEAYITLREEAEKTLQKQLSGFEAVEKEAEVSASQLASNFESQAAVWGEYGENLEKLAEIAIQIGGESGKQLSNLLTELSGGGLESAGYVAGLLKSAQQSLESGENTAEFDRLMQAFSDKTTAAAEVTDNTALVQALSMYFEDAATLAVEGINVEEIIKGLLSPEDVMKSLNSDEWYNSLSKAAKERMGLFGGDDETTIAAMERMGIISNELLPKVIRKTEETKKSTEDLGTQVEETGGKVDSFTTDSIEPYTQAQIDAKDATNDSKDAVNNMGDAASENAPKVDIMTEAVGRLHDALIALPTDVYVNMHTPSIPTQFNSTWSNTAAAAERLGFATGGNVPGVGMRDTVPAMLTPGEYVLKRSAAKALGGTVLSRLNNLDFGGAIDAMMSNFSRPALMHYSVTNTRNDNRQVSVTQNIQTNNPSYSYRVASRFAHAL